MSVSCLQFPAPSSLPLLVGLIRICLTLIEKQLGDSWDEGENWLYLLATRTNITVPERNCSVASRIT